MFVIDVNCGILYAELERKKKKKKKEKKRRITNSLAGTF